MVGFPFQSAHRMRRFTSSFPDPRVIPIAIGTGVILIKSPQDYKVNFTF